ncbi:hypothetical protein D3C79_531350 [compost metagenome]
MRLQAELRLEQVRGLLAIQRQLARLLLGEDAGHLLGIGEPLLQQLGDGGGLGAGVGTHLLPRLLLQGRAAGTDGQLLGLFARILVEQDQDDQGRGHGDSRQYQDAILDRAKLHLVFLVRRKLYELSAWREIPPAMLPSKAENEGRFCDPSQRTVPRPNQDLFRPRLLHGFPIRDSEC